MVLFDQGVLDQGRGKVEDWMVGHFRHNSKDILDWRQTTHKPWNQQCASALKRTI